MKEFLHSKNDLHDNYLDAYRHLINEVRAIYDFAGVSVEGAIRSFEDVLSFHDNLVSQKKKFITSNLPELSQKKTLLQREINAIGENKSAVFSHMRSEESISQITKNLKALGEIKVELGKLEGLVDQQQKAGNNLKMAENDLQQILSRISTELDLVSAFGEEFNKNFKRITQLIHAEPYEFNLDFDEDTGVCALDIKSKTSNPEGGKKKAEVIAFDISYICAIAKIGLKRPLFVFHDSIEDIDQKQIDAIFALAESIPGQQIVSMLSDKFTDDMYKKYESDSILLLSEDDMFFRI